VKGGHFLKLTFSIFGLSGELQPEVVSRVRRFAENDRTEPCSRRSGPPEDGTGGSWFAGTGCEFSRNASSPPEGCLSFATLPLSIMGSKPSGFSVPVAVTLAAAAGLDSVLGRGH
jgi:hypothetical protein